jgi:hypothetical protein
MNLGKEWPTPGLQLHSPQSSSEGVKITIELKIAQFQPAANQPADPNQNVLKIDHTHTYYTRVHTHQWSKYEFWKEWLTPGLAAHFLNFPQKV